MTAEEAPAGLVYVPDFLTEDEERQALGVVEALDFHEVRMRGQTARRTVVHFGLDYAYESGELTPTDPLPQSLDWLAARSAELAVVDPAEWAEVLVSRYPPGAGIGWHRDAPMFGTRIAGVSLGSRCRMRFQKGKGTERKTYALELEPRSAYLLSGAARWSWQHSIPASEDLRFSITFRTLKRA